MLYDIGPYGTLKYLIVRYGNNESGQKGIPDDKLLVFRQHKPGEAYHPSIIAYHVIGRVGQNNHKTFVGCL